MTKTKSKTLSFLVFYLHTGIYVILHIYRLRGEIALTHSPASFRHSGLQPQFPKTKSLSSICFERLGLWWLTRQEKIIDRKEMICDGFYT